MKYGVVVCPNCRNPKVVLLSYKTSRCTRCNKTLYMEKLKIFCKTNSENKARMVIGLINADKNKSYNEFKKTFGK